MDFSTVATLSKRKKSDLLVLPFFKGKKKAEPAADMGALEKECQLPIQTGDFHGKEGEVQILYSNGAQEKRIALLGLGEKKALTVEKLRRAYSALLKVAKSRKVESLSLLFPKVKLERASQGIAEGLLLSNYTFEKLKQDSIKEDPTKLIKKCVLIGGNKKELADSKRAASISEGVYLARDLINGNADDVNPQTLAKTARDLAKKFKGLKATIFDKKRIQKEKMGLLLAVNRGSTRDPAFIILEGKVPL